MDRDLHALASPGRAVKVRTPAIHKAVACLALAPLAWAPGESRGEQPPLRVMSFNIRYATADDGPNRWELRRELLVDTVRAFTPDLLGTQETLAVQKAYLDERLPGYGSVGVGRDDGKARGEMTAIWFRHDRFDRLDEGHFWLSERPDIPGSRSWDAAITRMASWVKLRDHGRADARPVLFVNTHFDHRGPEARLQSARLVRSMALRLGEGCDVIIAGDFNADEGSPPHRELFGAGQPAVGAELSPFRDAFRLAVPQRGEQEGTFNGFDPGQTSGPRIDWIGVSAGWTVRAAGIDRTTRDGATPSDHFPATATLDR